MYKNEIDKYIDSYCKQYYTKKYYLLKCLGFSNGRLYDNLSITSLAKLYYICKDNKFYKQEVVRKIKKIFTKSKYFCIDNLTEDDYLEIFTILMKGINK